MSNPVLLSVAAFIAKNAVNGNRAAQEWLLEWSEVQVAERDGKTIGVTTAVGLTKVDRLQRGETKPLQCSSGCTGKLELTEDGSIDVAALCPAHLLLALREVWADRLQVAVKDVQGPVFADMARFDNVGATSLPRGATLVAVDESSPAFSAKPKQAVLIITKAEEAKGRRYRGDEELRDGDGKASTPSMGPLYFEVSGQPYAVRVWCDAATATARMRKLAIAANRQAKKAKSELPFGDIFVARGFRDQLGSRSLRRTMATACAKAQVPEAIWMPIGGWKKRETAMKYVENADPFATLAVNVSDVVVHGHSLDAASDSTLLLKQLSTKDGEMCQLVEENTRMRALLELHGLDAERSMGAASQAMRSMPPPERMQLALSGAQQAAMRRASSGVDAYGEGGGGAAEWRGGGGGAAEGRNGGGEVAEWRSTAAEPEELVGGLGGGSPHNVGMALMAEGNYGFAGLEFEKALDLDNDALDSWVALGVCMIKMGETQIALSCQRQVQRLQALAGQCEAERLSSVAAAPHGGAAGPRDGAAAGDGALEGSGGGGGAAEWRGGAAEQCSGAAELAEGRDRAADGAAELAEGRGWAAELAEGRHGAAELAEGRGGAADGAAELAKGRDGAAVPAEITYTA